MAGRSKPPIERRDKLESGPRRIDFFGTDKIGGWSGQAADPSKRRRSAARSMRSCGIGASLRVQVAVGGVAAGRISDGHQARRPPMTASAGMSTRAVTIELSRMPMATAKAIWARSGKMTSAPRDRRAG